MSIEWGVPPPSSQGHSSPGRSQVWTPAVLAALRANPGRWAIVARDAKHNWTFMAWARRNPGFEVTSRGPAGGPLTIYARYVGGDQS